MDRKGVIRRALILLLILGLTLPLSGCRTRTVGGGQETPAVSASGSTPEDRPGERPADGGAADAPSDSDASPLPEDGGPGGRTKENPEASRKEYDENAPAEVVPGTDRLLHREGEGSGAALPAQEDAREAVSRLNDEAEQTATQTVAAPEAEEMGVSEDAEAAESAMTYFTVLLKDRTGSLYECQRANVYWETKEDHVTVHKSSPEHALILEAGAYDVSARLLKENLRVDDGWVARKNPQVIVKIVSSSVLGSGVLTAGAAKAVYRELCAREGWANIDAVKSRSILMLSEELLKAPHLRLAAMLLIAKAASPELYADVDPDQALRMLAEEATGAPLSGLFYFSAKEE